MMRSFITGMLLTCCLSVQAYEERNLLQKQADMTQLADMLVKERQWVSYPRYPDREGWNKLLGGQRAYCIREGEKHLDYQWQVVKATDYLDYPRTGNRSRMENLYNDNLYAISSLFIAEMAEGEGRFIDQLINGVFHTCEMTSWAIAAHLSLQRSQNFFPEQDDAVIELVSGDVGSMFSWIYYFLHQEFDKVNPVISERLYNEIDRRILTPYLNETRFWWMAVNVDAARGMVNNWNPWCNSNVLQCFLLLENDPQRLTRGVYKTMVSVDKFINYNHSDGACEEGPSYWGHAAGKMYDYLQLLYDATNGQVSIFSEPMIKNMGEYISRSYVGNGWVVNFADASAKGSFDYRLIYRYGKMVQSPEMMQFAAYLKKNSPNPISIQRDAYRLLADLASDKEIENIPTQLIVHPFTWYPETEFCYIRNDKLFFAAKGGYNDESHNHNDAGTFSLYFDSDPFFIDAGVGTYTKQTFSSERYSIWTMQSDFHNLPRINGYSQHNGKKYRAKDTRASRNSFSLDLAGAYPEKAGINRYIRTYTLKGNTLLIEDKFDITNPTVPNQLNFMTWGQVDLSRPGEILITVNNKNVKLRYDRNAFEPSLQEIVLDDIRLSRVWGPQLYRISLDASKTPAKGTYSIEIKPQD